MSGKVDLGGTAEFIAWLKDAERSALQEYGALVVARARARAPVRKITPQQRRKSESSGREGRDYIVAALGHYRRVAAAKGEVFDTNRATAALVNKGSTVRRRGTTNTPLTLGFETKGLSKARRKVGGGGKMYIPTRGRNRGQIMNLPGGTATARLAPGDRFRVARGVGGGLSLGRVPKSEDRGIELPIPFTPDETFGSSLSARGRYEVRSGRATVKVGSRIQVGGRLKESIEYVPKGANHGEVQATAPYAIYVEFPTSHNRAQPFLLPALHDTKRQLEAIVRKHLAGGGEK